MGGKKKSSSENVVKYRNGGGRARRVKTKRTGRTGKAVKKAYGSE